MDEVTGVIESEIVRLLLDGAVVDCDVLPGRAEPQERADEYVSVVALEAEYRAGNTYLVELEFRVVVPVDETDAIVRQKERLRQVVDWVQCEDSPLRGFESEALRLHGHIMRRLFSKVGERSRAEIAHVRFGATALRS
jgi:hypothetical protein